MEQSLKLADVFHAVADEFPPDGVIEVPGDPDTYISVFRNLTSRLENSADPRFYLFVPEQREPVVTYLTQAVSSGRFDMSHYGALRTLYQCDTDAGWAPLASALQTRLYANSGVAAAEVNALLAAVLRLRDETGATAALKQLVDAGHVGHLVWICANAPTPDLDAIARCFYLHMEMRPTMNPQSHSGNSAAGYEKMKEFCSNPPNGLSGKLARMVMNYERADLLPEQLDEEVCTPLVAKAMATFIGIGRANAVYSPRVLVDHWGAIRPYTPLAELLEAIDDTTPFVESVISSEFVARLADLYLGLLEHVDDTKRQALVEWSLSGIQSQAATTWKAEMDAPMGLLSLARYLNESGYGVDLSDGFRTSLVSYAGEIAGGTGEPAGKPDDWEGYAALLDPDGLMLWRDELYELAKQRDGDIARAFFSTFGRELAKSEAAGSDRAFVTHLVVPLLVKRNVQGLDWWLHFLRTHPDWVGGLPERYRSILRTALFECVEAEDAAAEHAHEAIRALRFQKPRSRK